MSEIDRLKSIVEDLSARLLLLEQLEAIRIATEAGEKPRSDTGYFNKLRERLLEMLNPARGNSATEHAQLNAVDVLTDSATTVWRGMRDPASRQGITAKPLPPSSHRR